MGWETKLLSVSGPIKGQIIVGMINPDWVGIDLGYKGSAVSLNEVRYEGFLLLRRRDYDNGPSLKTLWHLAHVCLTKTGSGQGPTRAALTTLHKWAPKFTADWVAKNPDVVALVEEGLRERERVNLLQLQSDLRARLDEVSQKLSSLPSPKCWDE